jgi:hypothetical protein
MTLGNPRKNRSTEIRHLCTRVAYVRAPQRLNITEVTPRSSRSEPPNVLCCLASRLQPAIFPPGALTVDYTERWNRGFTKTASAISAAWAAARIASCAVHRVLEGST